MEQLAISMAIFNALNTHLMAVLSFTLSATYLYKYVCVTDLCYGNKPMYLMRCFIWALFGISWIAFNFVGLTTGRSILRAMIALIMFTEIAYNIYFIKDAIWGTVKWISERLFQTRQ